MTARPPRILADIEDANAAMRELHSSASNTRAHAHLNVADHHEVSSVMVELVGAASGAANEWSSALLAAKRPEATSAAVRAWRRLGTAVNCCKAAWAELDTIRGELQRSGDAAATRSQGYRQLLERARAAYGKTGVLVIEWPADTQPATHHAFAELFRSLLNNLVLILDDWQEMVRYTCAAASCRDDRGNVACEALALAAKAVTRAITSVSTAGEHFSSPGRAAS